MIEYKGKYTTAKVMIDNIDEETARQIHSFINHPAFTNPVAIMPDTHAGAGAVIGFTMPMTDKVTPAAIGVDVGCGVLSLNLGKATTIKLPRSEKLDKAIRNSIPFGSDVHDKPIIDVKSGFLWRASTYANKSFCFKFNERFDANMKPTEYNYDWFLNKCEQTGMNVARAESSIGTLGGGR